MTNPRRPATSGFLSRLGVRLVVTFGLALLPLAILSYVQTRQYEQESNARAEAAVLGATLRVAAPQIDRIMQARGTAAALASSMLVIGADTAACRTLLRDVVERSGGDFSFAGYIRPNGVAECNSLGKPMDFSGNPRLKTLLADPKPYLNVNRNGPASGSPCWCFPIR